MEKICFSEVEKCNNQKRNYIMKKYSKLNFIYRFFILCLVIIYMPSVLKSQDKPNDKTLPPLKLELRADKNCSCEETKFIIIGKLENISNKVIIIDKRNLWRFVKFKGSPKGLPNNEKDRSFLNKLELSRYKVVTGDNFEDIEAPNKYTLELNPGDYYEDSIVISPKEDFFSYPGKYSVKTAYRQFKDWTSEGISLFIGEIESNELEFDIPDCKILK